MRCGFVEMQNHIIRLQTIGKPCCRLPWHFGIIHALQKANRRGDRQRRAKPQMLAAIFDQMTPEHIQFMLSKIPMGRFGTPDEVAAMVTWLLTEDCSFSTGAVFDLSGGRSTY